MHIMEVLMPQTRSAHSPGGNIAFFAKKSFWRCFPQWSGCFDEANKRMTK